MKKKLKWIVLILVMAGVTALAFWSRRADQILLRRVEGPETVTCWASAEGSDIRAVSRAIKKSLGPAGTLPGDFAPSLPGYTLEGWNGPDTWAVWSGGWLRDQDGVCYPCAPDWDALTARLEPDSQASIAKVAELAMMAGDWNTGFMERSAGSPVEGIQAAITEVRDRQLYLQVAGTSIPRVTLPPVELEVQLDGVWYTVPREQHFGPTLGMDWLEKGMILTPVVNIDLVCARYTWLPAGRYRIWTYGLTYEFTLDR